MLVRVWGRGYKEKRDQETQEPLRRRLQAANASPSLVRSPRPRLRGGRTGRRIPSAFRTRPSAQRSENIWDRWLMCPCPLGSPPSAPGNQQIRQEQRRGCFPKANHQQFCFFFFLIHPSERSGRLGVLAVPGLWRVPQRRPRGAGPGRMRQLGRRRPGPPAQPRSGRSPWQRARGGGAGRRRPRRLLFLPLPVPRGHVAMATMLLTAAASRHGWRA